MVSPNDIPVTPNEKAMIKGFKKLSSLNPLAPLSPETFAISLCLASSLQILENFLPRFPLFPWLKLGLSYLVLVPFWLNYGALASAWLLTGRNLAGMLFGGTPFSSVLISSFAGLMSLLLLGWPARKALQKNWIGLLGFSILSATAFNVLQLLFVEVVLIRHAGFFFQLGPLLLWSLASGGFLGLLIFRFQKPLQKILVVGNKLKPERKSLSPGNPRIFLGLLVLLLLLFFLSTLWIEALVIVLIAIYDKGRSRKTLQAAWPFFAYLAWLHLWKGEGHYIWREWVTSEGLQHFLMYSLRLGGIILLSKPISRFFPWTWILRSPSVYAEGLALALPLLPHVFPVTLAAGKDLLKSLWGKDEQAVEKILRGILNRLEEEAKVIPKHSPSA